MQGNYFSNGMSNMYGQNSLVRPNNVNFNPYLANDSYRNYGSSPYNFSSNYGNSSLSYFFLWVCSTFLTFPRKHSSFLLKAPQLVI